MNQYKEIAANAAVEQLEDGLVVGLGSGTTSELALAAMGRRGSDRSAGTAGVSGPDCHPASAEPAKNRDPPPRGLSRGVAARTGGHGSGHG